MIPKILAIGFGAAALCFLLAMINGTWRRRIVDLAVIGGIGWVIFYNMTKLPTSAPLSEFAAAVDLDPIRTIAVQRSGRLKSFDSHARSIMRSVSGSRRIASQEPAFTYLDMMFRPDAYTNADVIYVKNKAVRLKIVDRLLLVNAVEPGSTDTFMETGLIAPELLSLAPVQSLLEKLEEDLMRTAKPVNQIRSALFLSQAPTLSRALRIIPPPDGTSKDAWYLAQDVWDTRGGGIPNMDPETREHVIGAFRDLTQSWQALDADGVNANLARLASAVRTIEPSLYPDIDKLKLESWYFKWKSFTWVWVIYAMSAVPLLMSVIYRWPGARWVGVFMLVIAFAIHTFSLGLRWHISGRIPNANMFEAVTAAAWLGTLFAFILEFLTRKTPMRSMFFLGAAGASMVASMCTAFLPTTLSADIGNIMPILHDVWLYIHTNMIIWAYALIGMATITALLYLRHRLGGGSPDAAVLGGAGSLIMRGKQSFVAGNSVTYAQVLDGATMVLMEVSFIALWTGLVMGAIWADHSWGRPWGWDPKEVFALNTFIVFLVLVHVRHKVRDKGLWTAVLCTVGCAVMLFNWIVINFVITGLHSYA
jgi:cytochrome c-type biogenesis protein CcsB